MNIHEFIGLMIGDGCILYNQKNKTYRMEIAGDVKQDQLYFEEISKLVYKLTNKPPWIIIKKEEKGYGLRLILNNKKFVEFLIHKIGLPYGKKTFTIFIPEKFLRWNYAKHILRGIFESDGSLYFSKSKVIKYPSYPRIEIRTSSKKLAFQVFKLLKNRNFKVHIMKTKYNDFKIYLSGEIMLNKWIKEIGFGNINTITKYNLWKKLGYYIPKITLNQRRKL